MGYCVFSRATDVHCTFVSVDALWHIVRHISVLQDYGVAVLFYQLDRTVLVSGTRSSRRLGVYHGFAFDARNPDARRAMTFSKARSFFDSTCHLDLVDASRWPLELAETQPGKVLWVSLNRLIMSKQDEMAARLVYYRVLRVLGNWDRTLQPVIVKTLRRLVETRR